MTGRPDPALVLSEVETEALRQLRTRLNKPAASDAASATLGRAFLQVMARNGVEAQADPGGLQVVEASLGRDAVAVVAAIRGAAGLANLRLLTAVLARRLAASAADWRALHRAGAPQAVISRRLQLAGREPSPAAGEAAA